MKKILLLVAMACVASLNAIAETVGQAMLIHGETVTMFNSDKIQAAIEQAVDGDVIQLTEGTFSPFDVTKAIQIKGAGEGTLIAASVTVSIPNTPVLTLPVLVGMRIQGSVTLKTEMSNFQMAKCLVTGGFYCEAKNTNITIDRCDMAHFYYNNNFGSCNTINSWIAYVHSLGEIQEVASFINCTIHQVYHNMIGEDFKENGNYTSGTYINCVVARADYPRNTAFLYCLWNSYANFNLGEASSNLYGWGRSVGYDSLYDAQANGTLTTEDMINSGYIGSDGTVVGVYGGGNPFSLVVTGPKVTESDIKVDPANKKLNVNLKVAAN